MGESNPIPARVRECDQWPSSDSAAVRRFRGCQAIRPVAVNKRSPKQLVVVVVLAEAVVVAAVVVVVVVVVVVAAVLSASRFGDLGSAWSSCQDCGILAAHASLWLSPMPLQADTAFQAISAPSSPR